MASFALFENLRRRRTLKLAERGADGITKEKIEVQLKPASYTIGEIDPDVTQFRSIVGLVNVDTGSALVRDWSGNVTTNVDRDRERIGPRYAIEPMPAERSDLVDKRRLVSVKEAVEAFKEHDLLVRNMLYYVAGEVHVRISYNDQIGKEQGAKEESLEFFAENGGVCRHQAVAGVAILQRMREEGLIQGSFGVMIGNTDGGRYANHAWVEYTDQLGGKWVMDPTNLVVAKVEESFYKRAPLRPIESKGD